MNVAIGANAARKRAKLLACLTILAVSLACNGRYSHGRIPVDSETKKRWDAGEKDAEAAGKELTPIPVDRDAPGRVPIDKLTALLTKVKPSARHGADDERLLSLPASNGFRSANILAKIVLVKGSEYKAEKDFRSGWIPVAIIYRRHDSYLSTDPYPKIGLTNSDSSLILVREDSSAHWFGNIVPLNARYVPTPLDVTIADMDTVEPVIGARFVWQKDDEIIWTYCGGKCCQMRGIK